MSGTRSGAIERARKGFDDGRFIATLSELVAVPTESQNPDRSGELVRYAGELIGPLVGGLGFDVEVLDNPRPGAGPVMLATRIEDPAKPTVLIYGHGDVVRGHEHTWRQGLDPWKVTVEGDRIYGRGTADNKGQHLIAIEALRAVLAERGSLGFNAKVFIEAGEEMGSPGIGDFLARHRARCAADVFVGLDGPRQSTFIPEMRLGGRGGVMFNLIVKLREGAHHSGHWGGVLPDAGFILAHALASIVTPSGNILVDGWKPAGIPESVRRVCGNIRFEALPNLPEIDPDWGEPGLSKAEKIFAWTSVIVLAFRTGQPDAPVNAVQGEAKARLQVRHDVGISGAAIVPALRRHLDAHGFQAVQIKPVEERDMFPASRTDPEEPWVQMIGASMQETTGHAPNIVPNSSGSNPSEIFKRGLGVPVIWIPNSYAACGQHAADEHALAPLVREGLGVAAGVFWDFGDGKAPPKAG